MKKFIFTFLFLIAFITAAACGNETLKESEQKGEDPKQGEEELRNEEKSNPGTEGNEEANDDNQAEDDVKESIMKKANEVLTLLKEKSAVELADYVHPEKGVLFSPYIFVDKKAITFDKEKVKGFFENEGIYSWGTQDGSGEPIELTPSDYFSKFIYDNNFEEADEIVFDSVEARGNMIRNITEEFPDAHSVEYYVKGTEEYANMDWKALNLVFEQDAEGEWMLVAIVHDQWTI